MGLSRWIKALRKETSPECGGSPATPATSRLVLERLEDRVTPSTTNISISLSPNFLAGNVTETITATVTPTGTDTGPVSGNVGFTVNNQTAVSTVGSNNQATATFTLPVLSLLSGQTVAAQYNPSSTSMVSFSSFLSPVYLNLDNLLLPSTITFGSPPSNFTGFTNNFQNAQFNSAFGETDTVNFFFVPVAFTYQDPGTISSVQVFGANFSGPFASLVASAFINPFSLLIYPTPSLNAMASSSASSSSG